MKPVSEKELQKIYESVSRIAHHGVKLKKCINGTDLRNIVQDAVDFGKSQEDVLDFVSDINDSLIELSSDEENIVCSSLRFISAVDKYYCAHNRVRLETSNRITDFLDSFYCDDDFEDDCTDCSCCDCNCEELGDSVISDEEDQFNQEISELESDWIE